MSRDELIAELLRLKNEADEEEAHIEADDLLLEYIADEEITAAFRAVPKWYA